MKSGISLIDRAIEFSSHIAIHEARGLYTYQDLLDSSAQVASHLLREKKDLQEARVAFLAVQDADYVAMQWGIWRAGGIAVPISLSHPMPEIAYILEDTRADYLICTPTYADFLRPLCVSLNIETLLLEEALDASFTETLPQIDPNQGALIIYTSGTTSKPKGVLTTHAIIQSQITTLTEAWGWQTDDFILHVLPLHHVHGVINVLACALWMGAKVEMLPKFEAREVWKFFQEKDITLFMAVPTIYHRLIDYWEKANLEDQTQMSEAVARLRLMVSGSAALPISVLEKWKSISGHTLLERYGMTEIGMAISNPLEGERKAGHIGLPLPKVQVRLVDESGTEIQAAYTSGEIQIKGPNVFKEYWNKPEATADSFQDAWFCTGDIAQRDEEGYYKILGRNSVDIIKTGGYKVSALEIEEVLRTHPQIYECAVVGIPDEDWGERIAAMLITQNPALALEELRDWVKKHLAHYKIPTLLKIVDELPRNAMGKVMKPAVKKGFL